MARRLCLFVLIGLVTSGSSAFGEEPYVKFVESLREREYFDTALEYLESVETRPNLPQEVKEVIPFEKATTLMGLAGQQRNPEAKTATLLRAQAFLDQFLKASPDHPKAARANSDIANVLVAKGKVALTQSRSANNAAKRPAFIKEAKDNFAEAKKRFTEAAAKYDMLYKAFGPFVDQGKEPERFEKWRETERMKIRAELDAAIVQYEEAQVYEKDDPVYASTLKEAAAKFNDLNARHRSQVAGLYARMYEGKCFEEQGDLQKALGLYEELLSHPGDSGVMKTLQAQVTHFKLICLNSPKRADYVLVDNLAQKWVKENPGLLRTRHGAGIRLEQAKALESLSKARDVKAEDKQKALAEALALARAVNRLGGEYRDQSQVMITRLMSVLNRDGGDPKDFDTAYGMARELVNKIKEVNDAVKAAKDPESQAKAKKDLATHLEESARLLNLALALRKSDSKLKEVNTCRYSLCYVYYLQDRPYDSAILGEFVARRYHNDEESESLPSDAAYLAMAAYAKAYNSKGNSDKDSDIRHMISISDFIVKTWPNTPKSIEALMLLGDMYLTIGDFERAADAYSKIPEDAGQYLKAQLKLGQALWTATIDGLNKPDAERPPQEKLNGYQKRAQEVLKAAIGKLEPKLADNEELPEELAAARLTLSQMSNQTAQYAEAIKLLETDKRAVVGVINVKEGEKRPATGPKSPKFAQEVYKQILRAYIGLQNLENARKAMTELEKIAAGQGQDILPIYITLGKQFKEELDRLGKANPMQYQGVLKSFESFLANMLARKEGQNYNSLAWLGAMYVSLGEGNPDKAAASKYFAESAKAYTELITLAASDPKFCTEQQLLAAKAQMVAGKRKAGEYEEAAELLAELLKLRRNAIDTQTEACYVFQDWAASGQAESAKKWDIALLGDASKNAKSKIGMWGWAELSNRLARSPEAAKFVDAFLETRYNIAFCRYRSSMDLPTPKKLTGLGKALADIQRTTMQANLDSKQYTKFNDLYREIKVELGQPAEDIPKNPEIVVTEASPGESDPEQLKSKRKKSKKSTKPNANPAQAESQSMYMMGGVMALALVGGGAWYLMKGKGAGSKRVTASETVKAMDLQPVAPKVSSKPSRPGLPDVAGGAPNPNPSPKPKPPSKPKP